MSSQIARKAKTWYNAPILLGRPEKRSDCLMAVSAGEGTRMNHLHHHLVDRKLMRFAAIGTANTILGMGIMFGMYNWLGCGYWVSTAANYLITSVISFLQISISRSIIIRKVSGRRSDLQPISPCAMCLRLAWQSLWSFGSWLMSGTMCRKMCPCWSEWDCSLAAITWDSGWLCSER